MHVSNFHFASCDFCEKRFSIIFLMISNILCRLRTYITYTILGCSLQTTNKWRATYQDSWQYNYYNAVRFINI